MTNLQIGEQAPWFQAPTISDPADFTFSAAGGRVVLLMLAGSMSYRPCMEAYQLVLQNRKLFDDTKACFFGISMDLRDKDSGSLSDIIPGLRWFRDYNHTISRLYGSVNAEGDGRLRYTPSFVLLDKRLRVLNSFKIEDAEAAINATQKFSNLPAESSGAPVLQVPRVFDAALCNRLIQYFEQEGGRESGFMRERDGMTVGVLDQSIKVRSDVHIDGDLQGLLRERLVKSLLPEIARSFQFNATRIERYLIACYDGDTSRGGFFRPHRDNTTRGTAHRKFACTINLNSEEYEGGDLVFPEYGNQRYRAPTGGAVVFSCSLLHEATNVTKGKRYAFLPFFYDELGAQLRKSNEGYLETARQ